MKLSHLFRGCVNGKYIHVENSGDYYTDRIRNTLYIYLECSNGTVDWLNNFVKRSNVKIQVGYILGHRGTECSPCIVDIGADLFTVGVVNAYDIALQIFSK